MADTEQLDPAGWQRYRAIRLAALEESPEAFGSSLERERQFTEDDWRQRLASRILVRTVDGRDVAVGATFEDAPDLVVWAMWTEPAHRGQGHATALLHSLLDDARAEGRSICLDVNIAKPAAVATYERFGFVADGEPGPLGPDSPMIVQHMRLPRE